MMLHLILSFFLILGCQLKPTQIKEEPANQDNKNLVLVDTRSALEFVSFNISGSINLNTGDYLILKNPKTSKRILDPDLPQIIERLASRGISPVKKILLLSNTKDSIENKKWNWLLKQLGVREVAMMGFDEYRALHKNRVPQAPPLPASTSDYKRDFKKDPKEVKLLQIKADQCFVNWSDQAC